MQLNDLSFQEGLRKLFPNWFCIQQHGEVLRFACGLTADTQRVLDFVYQIRVEHGIQNRTTFTRDDMTDHVLEVLCDEISKVDPDSRVDPLHNRHFNIIDSGFGCLQNRKLVLSKFYVFGSDLVDQSSGSNLGWSVRRSQTSPAMASPLTSPAECFIHLKNSMAFYDTLKIIHYLSEFQQMSIVCLSLENVQLEDNYMSKIESHMGHGIEDTKACTDITKHILLNKNISIVEIQKSELSESVFNHVAKELHGCHKLEILDFSCTGGITVVLSNSIVTMKSLQVVNLSYCKMPPDVSAQMLKGLSQCQNLKVLDLSHSTLTDCMTILLNSSELHDSSPGLFRLESLNVEHTELSQHDLQCVFTAIHCNKLPVLKRLAFLPATLTDCLEHMTRAMVAPELHGGTGSVIIFRPVMFYYQQLLFLNGIKLSKNDITCLSRAAVERKLTMLEELDLSSNNLTDCMEDLFGPPDHPGFKSLKMLGLRNTKLTVNDARQIGLASRLGKLPKLDHLFLGWNNLNSIIKELFDETGDSGFGTLTNLELQKCELSCADVQGLARAIKDQKLPRLVELDLSGNKLKDCIEVLVGKTDHSKFSSLKTLYLQSTQLARADMRALGQVNKTYPNLRNLNLSYNVLTDCVGDLLRNTEGFPSISVICATETGLSSADINSFSEAVKTGKLRDLNMLNLENNALIEKDIENLIDMCIKCYTDHSKIVLITENNFPVEFSKRLKQRWQGTRIALLGPGCNEIP